MLNEFQFQKLTAMSAVALFLLCMTPVPSVAGNSGDRGGGDVDAKRFADMGTRLFQAVADQCLAGVAGNDSQPESLLDAHLVQSAVFQIIDPRVYRTVCDAIIFKTGNEFASAFARTHVVPSAGPLFGSDQNPRDALNNRKDLITLSPNLWKRPAENMGEVQDRLGLVAHEYLSVANLEESDQYFLSSQIVGFLSESGATNLAVIYGDLPVNAPLYSYSRSASATVTLSKTRWAIAKLDPDHVFTESFEEACINAKKIASSQAFADCSSSNSYRVCKAIRFEVLKATPVEATFDCKARSCLLSCTVRYTVGAYHLDKR